MTSTRSAIATALPSDRRGFLSTLAGAGTLGIAALPALAATPGPIEMMFAEHLRLEAEQDAAAFKTMDAEELYEEPPRPTWHPFRDQGGARHERQPDGKYRCYLDDRDDNIAYLREIIAKEHEPDEEDVGYRNAARAANARETLAKIEDWQAEVKRRQDIAGVTTAKAAEDQASAAASAHRDAMFAVEATTFRELAFLAAVLEIDWQSRRGEHLIRRLTELAAVSHYSPA